MLNGGFCTTMINTKILFIDPYNDLMSVKFAKENTLPSVSVFEMT